VELLEIKNINISYSYNDILVVRDVSLKVERGIIVALFGANAAGKSTILKGISGIIKCVSGEIYYDGILLNNLSMESIVSLGISHVPEGRGIFPGLTVLDNLIIATTSWWKRGDKIDQDLFKVFQLFPVLRDRKKQLGWSLCGGEQQMLAIGRGLMARPSLLLLDEPSLGLAPILVNELFKKIKEINQLGTSILLVEQNVKLTLRIVEKGYVLERGSVVIEDTALNLYNNEEIRKAYLGKQICERRV